MLQIVSTFFARKLKKIFMSRYEKIIRVKKKIEHNIHIASWDVKQNFNKNLQK